MHLMLKPTWGHPSRGFLLRLATRGGLEDEERGQIGRQRHRASEVERMTRSTSRAHGGHPK